MLSCVWRPFRQLLDAAEADEARDQASIAEFVPIPLTTKAQLRWLCDAVADLATAFDNERLFEEGQASTPVTESALEVTRDAISRLIEALADENPAVAERFSEYFRLNDKVAGGSADIAYVITGGIHNIVAVTLQAVSQAKDSGAASASEREAEDTENKPFVTAFRKRAGENVADLLTSRYGPVGLSIIALVVGWFANAGSQLASAVPGMFDAAVAYIRATLSN